MINVDKQIIHENIEEAYNEQNYKVKQLFEYAKKKIENEKECPYDYITTKQKASQFHTVSRIITKKKENENRLEENINSKFQEMNKKLDINSKNLDFIFESVAQNHKGYNK